MTTFTPHRRTVPGLPPRLTLDRRTVLTGLAGMGALSAAGCAGTAKPPLVRPPLSPAYTVDVHAHVHNATDLSIKGFAKRVVFERFEDLYCYSPERAPGGVFDDIVSVLVKLLSMGAVSAHDELAELQGKRHAAAGPVRKGPVTRRAAFHTGSLRRQQAGELSDEEILAEVLAQAEEGGLRPSGAAPSAPGGGSSFVSALREETGLPAEAEADNTRELARRTIKGNGPIGAIMRWALLLLKPRRYIISRYLETYALKEGGVHLFTPFLVDFEYWVDDKPQSPLADQVAVMDRLQRWVAETTGGARMHSFVPFCPWRDVAENGEAFRIVEDAVMNRGFLGVKLYPAMGFYPTDNAHQPAEDSCYPERSKEMGPNFPALLDRSLHRLYAWCTEHGVPIIAHANDSQGAGKTFAKRGHPKYWRGVVYDRRYRELRINMGHFGDFQESFYDPAETPWEETIGEYMADRKAQTEVYADLSYLTEMFDPYDRAAITERFNAFLAAFPVSARRLMFGTDWILVGKERNHEAYLDMFRTLLGGLNVDEAGDERIMHYNAMAYLGLNSHESPAYARIKRYHNAHNLDARWLDGDWSTAAHAPAGRG